jgi:hypothetical protein
MTKKKQSNTTTAPNLPTLPTQCFAIPTGQKNKDNTSLLLKVAVKPGSKQNNIVQLDPHIEEMSVQVAAPPVDGEANQELCEYIAKVLTLRKSQVSVHAGQKSRNKVLMISEILTEKDQQGNERRLVELYNKLIGNMQ